MTVAEGVCGGCCACNSDIAEAKRKAETEAAAKEAVAAAAAASPETRRQGEQQESAHDSPPGLWEGH